MCKIASLDNDGYMAFMLDKVNAIRKSAKTGISLDTMRRTEAIQCEGLAKYVLLDWKNLQNGDGTEIPYTQERALPILVEHKKIREAVLEVAQNEALYSLEIREEQEKNLQSSSDGN